MPREEILIRVDENDREIGTESRERCHTGAGLMHRAYVVFLFHDRRLLLQRRSDKKLLWPGFWDVSYTSHVHPGETYFEAAARRGVEEIGVGPNDFKDVLAFTYWAQYGSFAENEYCRLLISDFDGRIRVNPDEIMETKFSSLTELEGDIAARGERYTPWLKLALEGFLKDEASRIYR